MNFEVFSAWLQARGKAVNFRSDPVSHTLLEQILETAQLTPTSYNLQPVSYLVVTEAKMKNKLLSACFYQRCVVQAPALIVFTGDRRVVTHNALRVVGDDTDEHQRTLRRISFLFNQGFLGIEWIAKWLLSICWPFTAVPRFPAVYKRDWLTKQVMLSVAYALFAAEAHELSTRLIDEFDERRIKRVLKIPRHHVVPAIIACGFSSEIHLPDMCIPLEEKAHWETWNGQQSTEKRSGDNE